MSVETLVIEGNLVFVDYDGFAEELPSFDSPGMPEFMAINSVKFKNGTDALPFVMAIDDETEEQALAWVERLLDRKLTVQAEDQQGERMRSGRRAW
jgi:hypothetical protein